VLFSLQLFACFLLLFLLLRPSFNALRSDRMQGIISVFLYLLRLVLCPSIWSTLEKVPWAAGKNVYFFLLDEIFCRHQLGPFDLWCHLILGFLCWFLFGWHIIGDRGVLKSPTTTVLESICTFMSFSVHWMKLVALILGAYRLIFAVSFWCISFY
jgi:hypothetical protein